MDEEIKKAKERAMSYLLFQDRTKKELQDKLHKLAYSEAVVRKTIEYVESYGYINDLRYATNFIFCNQAKKSKKEIVFKLKRKGIENDVLEIAFSEYEGDRQSLHMIIEKKCKGKDLNKFSKEEKQKLIAYLARKGFSIHDILQEINDCLTKYLI